MKLIQEEVKGVQRGDKVTKPTRAFPVASWIKKGNLQIIIYFVSHQSCLPNACKETRGSISKLSSKDINLLNTRMYHKREA